MFTIDRSGTAVAAFTPPDATTPALTATVAHLNAEPNLATFINSYQTDLRPDARRYVEQDRQAMGDGSWRLVGLRTTPGGLLEEVNTFIEVSGAFVGIVEVVLPPNPTQITSELERAVNTFRMNPDASLGAVVPAALSNLASSALTVSNVTTWATPAGVFFITGEVANHTDLPLAPISVRVGLLDASGAQTAGSRDETMGYAILPGTAAPFSLRFDFSGGPPPDSNAFELAVETTGGALAEAEPIASGIVWQDSAEYGPDNVLVVRGIVVNQGSDTVESLLAVITIFDDRRGVIAAVREMLPGGPLEPEANRPFEVRIPEVGGVMANHLVTIQARP